MNEEEKKLFEQEWEARRLFQAVHCGDCQQTIKQFAFDFVSLHDKRLAEKLEKALVAWFYETDGILDDSSLDAFHDKSVVTAQAKKLAAQVIEGEKS